MRAPSFGPFGDIPENDVPFAETSIPRAVLDDQIAHYGANALENDPSVQAVQTTGATTQSYRIRGFQNQNMIRVDGLPLQLTDDPGFYDTERVDILKGATSVLYGFADPSGIVNYISKKPLPGPLTQVDLAYGTLTFGTAHIDVNRRFGDGGAFGVRVNLLEEGGGTSIRPQTLQHNMEAIAVDYQPSPIFKTWASYQHDDEVTRGLQGMFFLSPTTNVLPPVPLADKLILPPYTYQDEQTHTLLAGVEWAPQDWQINGTIGRVTHTFFYDFAQVGDGEVAPDGSFSYIPYTQRVDDYANAYRASVTRTLHLGSIVSDDISLISTGSHSATPFLAYNTGTALGPDSVINPIYYPNPHLTTSFTNALPSSTDLESVDLVDRLYLGDTISLWGGGIYSYIDTKSYVLGSSYSFSKTSQGQITPLAAIVVKPVSNVSVYFSYIEALQEGETAPSTATNANQTLPPFVGRQYEIGVKSQVTPGLELNADVFSVNEANAYLDPTDNTFVAAGQQLDRGVEFTARGKLTDNLKAFGGFMFMDAKVQTDPTSYLNNTPPDGVANVRGNLFLEYLIPYTGGLSILGGGYYTGTQFIDNGTAIVRVPSFATFDIGGKYETVVEKVPTVFRLYVSNVLNAQYWQVYNNIHPGDPRTGRLSVSMRF